MAFDLTGIGNQYATPGNYAEIVFAQGPSSAASGDRQVVFVMPKLSSGTYTAATLYQVRTEQEVRDGAGAGSPLHRAVRIFLQNNKDAKCFVVPVTATSGGSPAAATAVLTIANTATATGTINVWVAGELCQYTYASGETPTNIGDGIAASINAKTHLPCTASNGSGTVTLTAKINGASQGTGTLAVIRVRTTITSGTAVTASFGGAWLGTGAAGADGSTTEAANTLTALNAIASVRKYYIGVSALDATTLGHLETHITTKSEPVRGLRSVGIAAYTGSLATGITLATGRNYERLQIAFQPVSEWDTAQIVGDVMALRQKREQVDPGWNFNGEELHMPTVATTSDWLSADDIEDAIIAGLSPISSSDAGCRLVHSATTRSKDIATGLLNDARARRTIKVSVADKFVDDLLVRFGLRYGQKKFKDDERLADGTVNPNQKQIRNVVRPSMVEGTIVELVDDFADEYLQEIDAIKESISVSKSEAAAGRCVVGMDLHVIDWLDQITTRVAEVSVG
jgi:phage tail sheath gpL-like